MNKSKSKSKSKSTASFPICVYLIHRKYYSGDSFALQNVATKVMDDTSKKDSEFIYKKIDVKKDNVFLYLQRKNIEMRWTEYLDSIADGVGDIQNIIYSFVMFAYVDACVFAITGGLGYHAISKFIDRRFSLDIIERTFDRSSPVFRYLQGKNLVGNILSSSMIFRSYSNLTTEVDYGKIFEKIVAKFPANELRELGLENKKDCSCFAGSGFKLTSSLSFDETITLCKNLAERLKKEDYEPYTDIVEEYDKDVTDLLDLEFSKTIRDIVSNVDTDTLIDFAHKDIFNFILVDRIRVNNGNKSLVKDESPTILARELLQALNKEISLLIDDQILLTWLKTIIVKSFAAEDATPVTHGRLFDHFISEIELQDKKYFLVHGSWHKIVRNISNELNDHMNSSFKNVNADWMTKKFDEDQLRKRFQQMRFKGVVQYEWAYNSLYVDMDDVIVLDRVYYDGKDKVELCDLMRVHGDDIELVQVKRGFSGSLCHASQQIISAASVIVSWRQDHNQNKSKQLVKKYYKNAVNQYGNYFVDFYNKPLKITQRKFNDAFLGKKKITFVLAFIDGSKNDDFNPNNYGTILGKIAIKGAEDFLKKNGFNLKLIRIRDISKKA